MLTHVARRLASLVLTLAACSVVVFLVLEVLPGDVAEMMLGTEAREDTLAALRRQLGLDRPPLERYFAWIGSALAGDLGVSYAYGVPVAELLGQRLSVTVPLALIAFVLSTLIAIPLGMFAAVRHNTAGDYAVMGFSQIGMAVPNFWFAILLILFFAVQLGWFSAGGFAGWDAGIGAALKSLLLPAVALAVTEAAILARVTRSAVLETLREDYVRTARAKGLSEGVVIWRHALGNAWLPVITLLGLQLGALLGGAVITETVFSWPGIGSLLVESIQKRDYPVVQGCVLLISLAYVLVNTLTDLAYAWIDPRIRLGDG